MSQDLQGTRRDLPVTGVAEEVSDVARRDIRNTSRRKSVWRQNVWLIPVGVVLLLLIINSDPPFLTFNPAKQPVPLNPSAASLDYALILTHVLFGTVTLVALCLAVWPWLRIRHVAVHRWSGRLYVFTAMPTALLTLAVNRLGTSGGWHGDIGAYVEGGAWFTTTLIGYVAMRRGDQVRHRRWMLYSFAIAVAVVWGWVLSPIMSSKAEFPYLMELVRWVGWLLNMLVVKWWLDRTAKTGPSAADSTT